MLLWPEECCFICVGGKQTDQITQTSDNEDQVKLPTTAGNKSNSTYVKPLILSSYNHSICDAADIFEHHGFAIGLLSLTPLLPSWKFNGLSFLWKQKEILPRTVSKEYFINGSHQMV